MMKLLAAPEIWIGLGLLVMVAFLLLPNAQKKKKQARLLRVTQSKNPVNKMEAAMAQSLRRRNPSQDSAFAQILGTMRSISKLQARLEVSGLALTPQRFLGYVGGITAVTTLLLMILLHKPFFLSLLIGILLGLAIPHVVVSKKIAMRQLAFLKLFPEAIDLMVRGLRAGLPVAESFQVVSKELPPPMGDTFATISQQTQLGMPMERALAETAKKINLTEFNFFVTTIILQRETGGNLGEILNNLSDMLRQRHMMKLKISALSSEARASAMIVGSLPFVVFLLLQFISPAYLRPLFDDYRGNISLGGAAASMLLGGFIMRKMTQLEI